MKKIKNTNLVLILISCASFISSSCNKNNDDTVAPITEVFPAPIQNLISQSMIDSLRAAGGAVYSGTTPPIVNGIYLMQPDSCVFDNSPSNFTGTLFVDYKFRFTNQNNSNFTIEVGQKTFPGGVLSTTPSSTYISGSGNNFSILLLRTVTPGGIPVQQFNILSGTLTAAGLQNFQNILYVRSKGSDPGNTFPPAGTIRRFVNGRSGLAAISNSF